MRVRSFLPVIHSLMVLLFLSSASHAEKVPWSHVQFKAYAGAAIINEFYDEEENFGPPLPVTAFANVTYGNYGSDSSSEVTDSFMNIATAVFSCGFRDYTADAGGNFSGTYTATKPVLRFSYDYTVNSYDYQDVWIRIDDVEDTKNLFFNTLQSDTEMLYIDTTVGHKISIEFSTYARTFANGINEYSSSSLLFAYNAEEVSGSFPDIEVNGNEAVTIPQDDTLSITVTLEDGSHAGEPGDWWVLCDTPFGWYYYDAGKNDWFRGQGVTYQGELFDLNPYEVLNTSGLPTGCYTCYFGVDLIMNGTIDMAQIYYDSEDFCITQ